MKRLFPILAALLIALAGVCSSRAATSGDYQSQASGNWNSTATWQTYNGSAWVAASAPPTSASASSITIQNGHVVTVTAGVSADQVVVQAGGQITVNSGITLTLNDGAGVDLDIYGTVKNAGVISGGTILFESGGKYQHSYTTTAGTIPAATWSAGSTCEIIGYTGNHVPSGLGQAFWNFTWNTPAMADSAGFGLSGGLTTINGNFTIISTGSGGPLWGRGASSGGLTMNIGGDMIVQGGTFAFANSGSSGTFVLNIGGNYLQTGGTFRNDFAGGLTVHFTGAGKTFTRSGGTFTTANMSFYVDNAAALALNNNIAVNSSESLTVSSGGALNCGASTVTGGAFTLSSGATLGIGSPDGIASSGASGNIQTTTRSFSTGAGYVYNGSGAQVTGNGLPSAVGSLVINNAAGVTLTAGVTVNGTMWLTAGVLGTGANQVSLASGASLSGGGPASYVSGNLQKAFNAGAGQSFSFPIGDAASYTPVALANFNVAGAGSLTARTTAGDHSAVLTSGIDAARSVNRCWTLTAGGGLAGASDITFNYAAADLDAGATASQFAVRRFNVSAWSTTTPGGTPTTTSASIGSATGFGDFAIGNTLIDHYVVSAGTIQISGAAFNTTVTAQDILNQPVAGDSSTVVTMTGTGSVQFDGNGDSSFGDNTKTLSGGTLAISTRDAVPEKITLTARDANSKSGSSSLITVYSASASNQTIAFTALVDKTYGASPVALAATASSGLPVSFAIVAGPASVAGSTLTITGAGAVTVRASQAGNATWNPAPDVDRSFNVAKAPLTATADNKFRVYGADNPPLTATYSGFVTGQNTGVLSGSVSLSTTAASNSPVGTYPITVTQGTLSAANYSLGFVNGSIAVIAGTNGILFSDDFERPGDPGDVAPWVARVLQGSGDAINYSCAYIAGAGWTDYSVEAHLQFSSINAWGGGIGGRLNPASGAHYAAWIYPEGSPGGSALLKLIKFSDWTAWSGVEMARVALPGVNTNVHTIGLEFAGNQVAVFYDGNHLTNVTDSGTGGMPAYLSGGIIADTYTYGTSAYTMAVDNVLVIATGSTPVSLTIANDTPRTVALALQGTPGQQYVIQAANTLSDPSAWKDVLTNWAAADGRCTFTDVVTGVSLRFYRLAP